MPEHTYTRIVRRSFGRILAIALLALGLAATAPSAAGATSPAPTGLSYAAGTIAATVGTAIAPDTPSVTGYVGSYSASPALPAGFALNADTGVISGTPTSASAATVYTILAWSTSGSTTAKVTISAVAPLKAPSALAYSPSTINATVGKAIATDTPTVTGTVTSYAVTPALPAGLALSATTGALSGTPTAASAAATYTVTASNAGGSTTAAVTLSAVVPAPAALAYSPSTINATVGTAIATDTPTVTGTVTSYAVTPALPAGLALSATTGALSGTPTAASAAAAYTVTASNAGGSTTATVTLSAVVPLKAPTALAYSPSTINATVGTAIATATPTVTGTVTSYAVTPALPAGLALNTATGALSGTPTGASAAAAYTVMACNAAGSTTATVTLSAAVPAPTGLAYNPSTLNTTVGTAITPITPSVTGYVGSYSVSPALPPGFSLNSGTGILSGTPTAASAAAVYTILAWSTSGSTTATVTLSAVVPLPAPSALAYSPSSITATVGTAITTDTPSVTGTVTSYAVTPALPAGLALNAATGALSGTPTAPSASATYTVTASNAAGSTEAELVLVCDAAPVTNGGLPGFMAILQNFPSSALYASSQTAAAMAANPWMLGTRFFVGTENLCQDTTLPVADWNYDESNVAGFTDPLQEVMIRMSGDPDASWNIQDASAATNEDAVVAGIVTVANAAHTASFMLDPENYSTTYLLQNYNQTSGESPLLNSPSITRAAMCADLRAYGKAVGTSLWSRVPNARLYLTFGSTYILQYTDGGLGIPTSFPDASYAGNAYYNMLPYFCLGLLDACPATGRIIDYSEGSYYTFTGKASLTRIMNSSQNWVSIFFPTETADIAKSATCWVPVPLIFVNPYFNASYGAGYPGAHYITSTTDQLNDFTRNALYCLQQTPAGYMPGLYVETYDPWGLTGTVSNMPAAWQTCLANALSVYKGTTTLGSLFNETTLDSDLAADFSGNPTWVAECQ